MSELVIDPVELDATVEAALAEDIGRGDQTTQAMAGDGLLEIDMVARQHLIVAGMPALVEVLVLLVMLFSLAVLKSFIILIAFLNTVFPS